MKKYFRSWFLWIPIIGVLIYFTATLKGTYGNVCAALSGVAFALCIYAIKESAKKEP